MEHSHVIVQPSDRQWTLWNLIPRIGIHCNHYITIIFANACRVFWLLYAIIKLTFVLTTYRSLSYEIVSFHTLLTPLNQYQSVTQSFWVIIPSYFFIIFSKSSEVYFGIQSISLYGTCIVKRWKDDVMWKNSNARAACFYCMHLIRRIIS